MPYSKAMPNAIQTAAAKLGGQSSLARALGVTPPTVNQWIKGTRPIPAEQCVAIEQVTGGQVTRRQLRPSDWRAIWPELAEPTTDKKLA